MVFRRTNLHHRFPHPRARRQLHLNLARFDAEPAQLDLLIASPTVFKTAVRQVTRQIAGAIHAAATDRIERIAQEALCRQFRSVQVAQRHPAADVQFPTAPIGTGRPRASSK